MRIHGIVQDANGQPLAVVLLEFTDKQKRDQARDIESNAQGEFTTKTLKGGDYTWTAQKDGYVTLAGETPGVPDGPGDQALPNPIVLNQAGLLVGSVTDKATNAGVEGAQVTATDAQRTFGPVRTAADGRYRLPGVPPGPYTISVKAPAGYQDAQRVNVQVQAGDNPIPGLQLQKYTTRLLHDLDVLLGEREFNIETPVSREEANQAVSLFSVVNLMLAGLSRRRVGNEEKIDILSVLNLYYGLQDKSLAAKLVIPDKNFWGTIEQKLKDLATRLDQLQSDVDFLNQEAKRQFNLGTSNGVLGNTQFPALFRRYVEIGTDALLSINIGEQDEPGSFFDKEKLEKAYDLLRELKGLMLQIVRSLSKYGTVATRRVNQDWAGFEARALEVLAKVGEARASDDQDDKNPWAVLAELTEKNRELQVAPYIVLARHGSRLLDIALDTYDEVEKGNALEDFTRDHLLKIFQPAGAEFRTTRIRTEAAAIKRYPLANWG